MSHSRRSLAPVLVVWITVLVVWGLDTHGNWAGTGDELHYAMITHSLVFDHDFDMANDYQDEANLLNRGEPQDPGAHVRVGRGNVVRPVHDVGLPIIAAPYFAGAWALTRAVAGVVPARLLARARLNAPLLFRHFLSFGMIIVTALMARRFLRLVSADAPSRAALVWTLLIVLSPPILSHSFLFFTELPAAAIATWLYTRMVRTEGGQPNAATVHDVCIGAAIGFLPLLHVRLSGLACGFVLLYVWRRGLSAWRPLAAAAAPMLAMVFFKVWLNERFWGTLLTSPHVRVVSAGGVWSELTVAMERVMALCFDQSHGLLVYAPLYLTVMPGVMLLWQKNRRRCAELLLLIACYLVPLALPTLNAHGWEGGWSPAARFLVPVTPFLALLAFSCVPGRLRWFSGLSVLAGIQIALDMLYWSHPKILWNDVGEPSALLRFISPRGFDVSPWFPAWSKPSAYSLVLSFCLLISWIAVSILVVRARSASSKATAAAGAVRSG